MDFYNIGTPIYCRLHDDIYDECVACAQTDVVDRRYIVYSYGSLRDLLESEKFEFDYMSEAEIKTFPCFKFAQMLLSRLGEIYGADVYGRIYDVENNDNEFYLFSHKDRKSKAISGNDYAGCRRDLKSIYVQIGCVDVENDIAGNVILNIYDKTITDSALKKTRKGRKMVWIRTRLPTPGFG